MLHRSWVAAVLVIGLAVACVAQERPTFSVPFKELESYESSGRRWRNIAVDEKIKRDDLIKLARELHGAFPDTPFRIFTGDEKFKEFMLHDLRPSRAHPNPEAWAEKHYIAIINRMADPDGPRWQLYPMGPEGKKFVAEGEFVIADLD